MLLVQRGKNWNTHRIAHRTHHTFVKDRIAVQKIRINNEFDDPLETTRPSSITEIIDIVAFFLFLSLYILFNCGYFARYKT